MSVVKQPSNTKRELMQLTRQAKIEIQNTEFIENESEAEMLAALLKAFGDSSAGFIYIASTVPKRSTHAADIVLCHPNTGLIVIEVKGHTIEAVEGTKAGKLLVRYDGRLKPRDVFEQVRKYMYDILDGAKSIPNRDKPLYSYMVALPNITESDWFAEGYDQTLPHHQLIFRDQVENNNLLQRRIQELVEKNMAELKRSSPVPKMETIDRLKLMFGDSDVVNEIRPKREWLVEDSLGNYIDHLINEDKYLSKEQKECSQLPTGSYPRVIRGVAGSGKSIVLANMVARYLHKEMRSFENIEFKNVNKRIAVVCYNRTLVSYLQQRILSAYRPRTNSEHIPPHILLVTYLNDLMWTLKDRGWPISYIRISDVPDTSIRAKTYREQIEKFASTQPERYHDLCFDMLFVDEGQDIDTEEYRLLLAVRLQNKSDTRGWKIRETSPMFLP